MPEISYEKSKLHPLRVIRPEPGRPPDTQRPPPSIANTFPYAELAVTSNFTFLRGASHPDELVERAAQLNLRAIAITDTNTLAGVVRAHVAAKETGIQLIVGCRLALTSPQGLNVLVYPTDRPAYARLCRLLTLGKRRAPKGECHLSLHDLIDHSEGVLAVVVPPRALDDPFIRTLQGLRSVMGGDRLSLGAARPYGPDDDERLRQLVSLSEHVRVPLVAMNDVLYDRPERRPLQDVLTCIRLGCTIEEAGRRLMPNAERHLKPGEEMERLFARLGSAGDRALARTLDLARRAASFNLDQLRYEYPVEPCPPGLTPMQYLAERAWAGAARRYPAGIPDSVRASLEHELRLIDELRYEAYFLTCYDIVEFARSRGILCQGRGGAANSAVCYCLGITEVDPARFSLLFERFISRARNEPPDIDIDFEHERREEVIQHIYSKYGRDRAALTAEVISYRGRSAVREVGKAMGLSLDCVDALAKNLHQWGESPSRERIREAGLNPDDPVMQRVLRLTSEIQGFPRHLSQHVGGFVITRTPLCELVPIENAAMEDRTIIEWDKDDIDAMGMLKIDCLGLGMLTCIRKSYELLKAHRGRTLTIATTPPEDPRVYEMIQRADTVGVFQIESRAQMSMLPRLKPANFYDLVIEVAIVRPGPIQGDMVHPYLRRRAGEERVEFPSPEIAAVLERTLGVPLFQEQAMQIAIVAAGFTPDEADQLRRAMAAWRRRGDRMVAFGEKLIAGMTARGYPAEFARRCFEQIKGFSEYGFPESHAASFALLVYASAWLKCHEPAAFAAALINSQPMGFYQPAQIIRDAREHGVRVLPIDVNHSRWDCTLEDSRDELALRLGMRLVKGLAEAEADRIAHAAREHGPFTSAEALWRASGVGVASLRRLARADAFASMNMDRQRALWALQPLRDERLPLFEQDDALETCGAEALPPLSLRSQVLRDYLNTGLSLKAHPISFIRSELDRRGVLAAADLRSEKDAPTGRRCSIAGVVLIRQRPSTASGVVFITLEDETGIANLVLWPRVFERFRRVARLSVTLLAHGKIERQGEVVHLHVDRLESLDESLQTLESQSRDFH